MKLNTLPGNLRLRDISARDYPQRTRRFFRIIRRVGRLGTRLRNEMKVQ